MLIDICTEESIGSTTDFVEKTLAARRKAFAGAVAAVPGHAQNRAGSGRVVCQGGLSRIADQVDVAKT
ncbi:hypothetical protein ACOCG7_00985 [Paraburkholderia sp. DD10]|uniref:hypothetical protein n=1 Tax=Paraburkholderia sp. DD10 TaxID=3409691 RepID=UPI003BA258CA